MVVSVAKEGVRVYAACLKHAFSSPVWLAQLISQNPGLNRLLDADKVNQLLGDRVMLLLNDLGPFYGKISQILASRVDLSSANRTGSLLSSVFDQWPALPFSEVEHILDTSIPHWRKYLQIEPVPLGVASIGQVHAASDREGRKWVVKVIKPQSKAALLDSLAAVRSLVQGCRPFLMTQSAKKTARELDSLCKAMLDELSLIKERQTIERLQLLQSKRRQRLILIPEVHPRLMAEDVLVIERFQGVPLSRVVTGEVKINKNVRQKLARHVLHEMLIQIFELGLFHGDPHAGNLILTDSGEIGLFDWGLSGELLEGDRQIIANVLRAVLAVDMEKLVDALLAMPTADGKKVKRERLKKELRKIAEIAKKSQQEGKKPSMHELFEQSLNAAARLKLEVPEGLLLMVKSLMTIEGLAKGLDPEVSVSRMAFPVLFRAAKPSLTDWLKVASSLPKFAKQFITSKSS